MPTEQQPDPNLLANLEIARQVIKALPPKQLTAFGDFFRKKLVQPATPPELTPVTTVEPVEAPPPTTETAPITPPAPPAAQSSKGWPTLPPADVRFEVRDEDVQVKQEPPLQQTETPIPAETALAAPQTVEPVSPIAPAAGKQPGMVTTGRADELLQTAVRAGRNEAAVRQMAQEIARRRGGLVVTEDDVAAVLDLAPQAARGAEPPVEKTAFIGSPEEARAFAATLPEGSFRYKYHTGTNVAEILVKDMPEAPAGAAAKQPWEMTGAEFSERVKIGMAKAEKGVDPFLASGRIKLQEQFAQLSQELNVPDLRWSDSSDPLPRYRVVVERALSEGKPVPPDVVKEFVQSGGVIPESRLADYPDLAPPPPEISDLPVAAEISAQGTENVELTGEQRQAMAREALEKEVVFAQTNNLTPAQASTVLDYALERDLTPDEALAQMREQNLLEE